MRFTRATEYAFRALRYLSTRKEERWFSIQEIAEAEDMPIQFLAKVMQHLTQGGLVHSACGKTGGYRLGRAANQIFLADVVLAMEGPLTVNTCLLYPSECKFSATCKMHPVWEELQGCMLGVLRKYTIASVAPEVLVETPSRRKPRAVRATRAPVRAAAR